MAELKQLLRGLGGDSEGLLEKTEFVSAVEENVKRTSIKELKAKVFRPWTKSRRFFGFDLAQLAERGISIPSGSEKHELVALLAAPTPTPSAAPPSAQTAAALTVDFSTYTDQELGLLARDRNVAVAGLNRGEAIAKINEAARAVRPKDTKLLEGWLGAHEKFRQAAVQLEQQGRRLVARGAQTTDADVDAAVEQLNQVEGALQGHGGWEEKTVFPFLKKEFVSFEKYDASLESQHDKAHRLAQEIISHSLVFKSRRELPRLERIAFLLREYSQDLHAHLALEEAGVVSLVNNFNPQQACQFAQLLGGCGSSCGPSSSRGGCGPSSCGPSSASCGPCGPKQAAGGCCGSSSKARNACGGASKCGDNCC